MRREGDDLTSWLESGAEGLRQKGERMRQFSVATAREKMVLRPRQEGLLKLLGKSGRMTVQRQLFFPAPELVSIVRTAPSPS